MPMTQQCIRTHYEASWKQMSDAAKDVSQIAYSGPVEDGILYPLYRQMIADLKIKADGGDVLDVGSGSGRWIRFFLEHFSPRSLTGSDYTRASVDLLRKWFPEHLVPQTQFEFQHADITSPDFDLGRQFDLISIANVLFHIPEHELFAQALANLSRHCRAGGTIVTTEYLPRSPIRTEWMYVRDRYTFERMVKDVGLRITAIKAFSVFANDPMGLDGFNDGPRGHFNAVRTMMNTFGAAAKTEPAKQFAVRFLSEIERAMLAFCAERVADIDMPSQKLVFLTPV